MWSGFMKSPPHPQENATEAVTTNHRPCSITEIPAPSTILSQQGFLDLPHRVQELSLGKQEVVFSIASKIVVLLAVNLLGLKCIHNRLNLLWHESLFLTFWSFKDPKVFKEAGSKRKWISGSLLTTFLKKKIISLLHATFLLDVQNANDWDIMN